MNSPRIQRKLARAALSILLLPFLVLAVGCGDEHSVDLVPVSGKVTSGGKPAGGFTLSIIPEAGPVAAADVAADGTFRTEAVAGKARIVVLPATSSAGHDQGSAKIEGVSSKYMDNNSTLEITIPEGGGSDIAIEVGS